MRTQVVMLKGRQEDRKRDGECFYVIRYDNF